MKNFSQKRPEVTQISRGQYRLVEGRLEELILHIQHRRIGDADPFCREIWQEVALDGFGDEKISFDLIDNPICILSWTTDCRRIMPKHTSCFVDENGFVCFEGAIFLSDQVLFSRAYVLVDRHRVRVCKM